jgi:hypothetical protein
MEVNKPAFRSTVVISDEEKPLMCQKRSVVIYKSPLYRNAETLLSLCLPLETSTKIMQKGTVAGAAAAAGSSCAAAGTIAQHGRMRRLTIADQYLLQQLKVCRPRFSSPLLIFPIGACVWHVYVLPFFLPLFLPISPSLCLSLFPFLSLPPSLHPPTP